MHLKTMEADLHTYGFPPGYFVIKNLATGRVLDVDSGMLEDGAPLILYPETETFLVEGAFTTLLSDLNTNSSILSHQT